jgi:hypothetical protein
MPIVYACIQSNVGNSSPEAPRTAKAIGTVTQELGSHEPELVVVIHSQSSPRSAIRLSGDENLTTHVVTEAKRDALPVERSRDIDSLLRPLLKDSIETPDWLWIATSALELRSHFEFGQALARGIDLDGRSAAAVCVVELAGTPDGALLEKHYRRALADWDVKALVNMETSLRQRSREHAVAQTAVLMGALGGYRVQTRELAYEVVGGKSYIVAAIDIFGARRAPKQEVDRA